MMRLLRCQFQDDCPENDVAAWNYRRQRISPYADVH